MTRTVPRPELGELLATHREFFPTDLADLQEALARRPLSTRQLRGLVDRARDLLGRTSWFALTSHLLLDCARLQGQAAYGCALVAAATAGQTISIRLGDAIVSVVRDADPELGSVADWSNACGAALAARDEVTLAGMRAVPTNRFRAVRVQIDEYQYPLAQAFVEVSGDRERCLAAVSLSRAQWKQHTVAKKSAAAIDAALLDVIEALVAGDAAPFNDALHHALTAHAKYWGKGDDYLAARGWVAVRHVGLACLAHDRGLAIEVESPYLPRALIERVFLSQSTLASGLTSPPTSTSASSEDPTRGLALLAGEEFARAKLEPDGYRRIDVERRPLAGFDYVYSRGEDVVVIDTLAADQQLDGLADAAAGTRCYVERMIANMRTHAPNAAASVEAALRTGRLRYFEVRQSLDDDGDLGEIEIRQFVLS